MNFLNMYQALRSNPAAVLSQRFNLSGVNMNDPNEILQHLVSSGQVSQSQINSVMAMRNNPAIQALMNR